MTVIVNCSNVPKGGGEQVTLSLIENFKGLRDFHFLVDKKNRTIISRLIDCNLSFSLVQYSPPNNLIKYLFYILECRKILARYSNPILFNIFGPTYLIYNRHKTLSGFANAAIFYNADNTLKGKILFQIESKIKQLFLKIESHHFWVETNEAKNMISEKLKLKKDNIVIANNSASQSFIQYPFRCKKINSEKIRIFYPALNYHHKNHTFLSEFFHRTTLPIQLFVTLDDKSFKKTFSGINNVRNLGYISNENLPQKYQEMDIILNASSLEIFSAVLVEAHISLTPIISVDLPYAREICKDYAMYYKVNDEVSLSHCINSFMASDFNPSYSIYKAKQYSVANFSEVKRFEIIIDKIKSLIKNLE